MGMKKYDVFGLGNALLDLEFKVTPRFLKEFNLEKGSMTLVSEERQQELMRALGMGTVLNIAGGGSAANTLVTLQQLGGAGCFSFKIADDWLGQRYLLDIEKSGLAHRVVRPPGQTGSCLVMVTKDGDRTMTTHLGVNETLCKAAVYASALIDAKFLFIEGYLLSSASAFEAILEAREMAKANQVKVALTLSDALFFKSYESHFGQLLASHGVDLLFCNEEEALACTKTSSINDAKEALKEKAKTFVITRGSSGAVLYDGNSFIHTQSESVKRLSSLGAGDTYAGAFLYGMTRGLSFEASGILAAQAATEVVKQYGPRLSKEVLERVKSCV